MSRSIAISIGTRITLTIGLIIALLAGGAIYATYHLSQATKALRNTFEVDLELARRAERWGLMVQVNVARAFVRANVDLGAYRDTFETDARNMSDQIGKAQKSMEELVKDDAIRTELLKVIDVRMKTVAITDHIAVLKASSDKITVDKYIREIYEPQARIYLNALQGLADFAYAQANDKINNIERNNQQMTVYISCLLILTIIMALFLSRKLGNIILPPLRNAVQIGKHIAEGNLTMPARREGIAEFRELSDALCDMQNSLSEKFTDIQYASGQINQASEDITSGNRDLSSRTEYQMSSLEQTHTAMSELTRTVQQNAVNAKEAHKLVDGTSAIAIDGGKIMEEVVAKMTEINDASQKIADIITVIDGISFQTNILALNAAVEAARAGEQGRGFAVVASEVRNLAQRSANSAKEIKDLIDSSVEKINQENKLVEEAGSKIRQIVEGIRKITAMMAEINHASQEQNTGISSINTVFHDLEQIANQNAKQVSHANVSADLLKSQAEHLAQIVSAFRLQAESQERSLMTVPKQSENISSDDQPPLLPK